MAANSESSLLAAGFLRQRCNEPVDFSCPGCGTIFSAVALMDFANGILCNVCGKTVFEPLAGCARCKGTLPPLKAFGERECQSIAVFRASGLAAFAPAEPLWEFKRSARGKMEVAAESELSRRFLSGELDDTVFVRPASQNNFVRAGECPEYRDVARPRPTPSTTSAHPAYRGRRRPVNAPSPSTPAALPTPRTTSRVPLPSSASTPVHTGRVTFRVPLLLLTLLLLSAVTMRNLLESTRLSYSLLSREGYVFSGDDYHANINADANYLRPGRRILRATSDYFMPFETNVYVSLGKQTSLQKVPVSSHAICFKILESGAQKTDIAAATWRGQPIQSGKPIKAGGGEFAISLPYYEPFRTNIFVLPGHTIDLGEIHLERQHTVIRLTASDDSARFQLTGPQQLDAWGSVTLSNAVCGDYKLATTIGVLMFETNIVASVGRMNTVEYNYEWRTIAINVISEEKLSIYLGEHIVGKTNATIKVPLGLGAIPLILRGKGTTRVRVYENGEWSDYYDREIEFYQEVPLTLKSSDHLVHHNGTLATRRSYPSKARPYQVSVEINAPAKTEQ